MPYMNMETARNLMQKNGVDAIVATAPSDFCFTSGYHLRGGFLPGATVIPADPSIEPVMVVSKYEEPVARATSSFRDIRSFPEWLEIVDVNDVIGNRLSRRPKPSHYDDEQLCLLISSALKDNKLEESTIGVRMPVTPGRTLSILCKQNPKAKFVEAEGILRQLRQIKTAEAIDAIRVAASLGVKGIHGMVAGGVLGEAVGELQLRYRRAVLQAVSCDTVMKFTFGRGVSIIAGDPATSLGSAAHKVSSGTTLFIDCGVVFNGYVSDMGRTFIVGKPNPLQLKIYRALRAGFEEGLALMKPGVTVKTIFNTVQDTIRRSGLEWYSRGHLGHGLGMYPPEEEAPYICADDETVLEPNMVMCLETPLYVNGLGAFQIEDIFLITGGGHEILTQISRDLVEL